MKHLLSFGLSGVAVLLLPATARAVPGDEHWDPQFNWPGTTNAIFGIAVHNGNIYAGGNVSAGSTTNAALEVWDGLQWSTMGLFTGSSAPEIYDIAFAGDTLYVAGTFNAVNGATINGLAKWNGANWTSAGLTGIVLGLAVDGNNLYAAGVFTNADAGGMTMTNVGSWDGSAWHALGGGVGKPGSGNPRTIVAKNGLVYAGGIFTNSGSQFITNLAVWNGSSWSAVGGGVGTGFSAVYSLAFNGSDLYAGGFFTQAGATLATNIARWDGTNWSAVGGGVNGSGVNSVAILNGSVCVAGSFSSAGGTSVTNFAVWNGSSWSGAGGGISSTGYRVVGNAANVVVGGNFLTAGNKLVSGIALFDGSNWSPIGTAGQINGVSGTVRALASDGTNLYAGGAFSWAGQTNAAFVARWDGTNWLALGGGIGGSPVINAIAVSNNNVYVGGSFTSAGGVSAQNIARWDGTNWLALGGGPGGIVASILVRTDGVYAAGAPLYGSGPNYGIPFCSRWDGTSWQNIANFNPSNSFFALHLNDPNIGMDAVASIGTNIYVGGHFSITQFDPAVGFDPSTNCLNILRSDGATFWIVGTGVNSNVVAMAVLDTNLYVAGLFTNAGGVTAAKIAQWNGIYWTNVGGGLVGGGVINALAVVGGNLYAGGTFTNMGGVGANHVAKWDGTNWSALGNGTTYPGLNNTGPVLGLAGSGNNLYAGGTFRSAGNKPSFNIARWNAQINFNTPQISPLPAANGQFRMRMAGIGGLTNIVQATTDFATWTPILTNSTGIYDFTDPDSLDYPFRCYRAVLGP